MSILALPFSLLMIHLLLIFLSVLHFHQCFCMLFSCISVLGSINVSVLYIFFIVFPTCCFIGCVVSLRDISSVLCKLSLHVLFHLVVYPIML